MSELATYELDGRIATITLDDGKVNAFSIAMLRAIHGALDEAERDEAVVVLRGREGYFSAGFDLKVFGGGDVAQVLEMLNLGATLAERLLVFKTPVAIASTGHTVAAGAFLLLAADCRIGTDGPFQVGLNEVKIGLTVPWFVIELARQRLHPAHFSRAVVCASMYGPREAARLAELNAAAHTATKLRARSATLAAMRSAIESELTVEGLSGAGAPA